MAIRTNGDLPIGAKETPFWEDKTIVGGYNDNPPNLKEITQLEFCQSMFFSYGAEHIESRQVIDKSKGFNSKMTELWLYWYYDHSGVAIEHDYWKGTLKFFKFTLCEHDYKETNLGRCFNRLTCQKCGFSQDIDSSD
jgi:hypothetical protein